MRRNDIEAWAIRVLDSRGITGAMEDASVEAKGEWPRDMNKAARRLAGHCNALRGDDGLWIVGVDEKSGVLGVEPDDFADWWPRLKAEFHDATPDLTEVFFTYEGKRLVALHFTTDRAPFLVRVQGGGRVEREVPWREGTSVRTARRADLLRLLVPLQRSPELEITKANAKYYDYGDQEDASISVDLTCYMTSRLGETLVFPEHRAMGQLRLADSVDLEASPTFVAGSMERWGGPRQPRHEPDTGYMASADHQLSAAGPGFFRILARAALPCGSSAAWGEHCDLRYETVLRAVDLDRPVTVAVTLSGSRRERSADVYDNDHSSFSWQLA